MNTAFRRLTALAAFSAMVLIAGNLALAKPAPKASKDMVDTLKSKGPFTVFAPTDDAFAKLPAGTVENLLKPENKEKLKAILLYHVVSGKVEAKDAMKLSSAKTVNGESLNLMAHGDSLMINNATVVKADIECSNGVIHVIDTVLLPQ